MNNLRITVRHSQLMRTMLLAGGVLYIGFAAWTLFLWHSWSRICVYEAILAIGVMGGFQGFTRRLILDEREITQRVFPGRSFHRPYSEVASIYVGHSETFVYFVGWGKFTPTRARIEMFLGGWIYSRNYFKVSHRLLHPRILIDAILARAGRDVPVTIAQGKVRAPRENGPGEKRTD